jgi:tetratricopeptide (TPR) repeat protein
MGIVYVAEDISLGRRVAIKTLTTRGCANQQFRRRFKNEARLASKLSHPHIATVYDYGETDKGQPFLVMELVQGKTLNDLIRNDALTIPRTLEIVRQVAAALSEAHRHGLVHRDIKPSNIAINEQGSVKVLDFGLAKEVMAIPDGGDPSSSTRANTQTLEGIVVGTPLYLSPEQALRLPVDARSDLFSLGSVLYECITGQAAFAGKSDADICAKVIRDDPAPPSQFNTAITKELDHVTLKALAKKPEGRCQSAEEFLQDLLQVDSQPVASPSSAAPATKMMKSRGSTISSTLSMRRVPLGYVLLGIAALVLGIVSLWYVTRPKVHVPSAAAQKWYDLGTNSIREGEYFKAIKPLQQAITLDEGFVLAHARLAEVWSELDYMDRAQREMLLVDGLTPNRTALPKLDRLYLDAIRATITRDVSGAVRAYEEVTQLKPNDAQAYVDLGRAYERNDQIDEAIDKYKTAAQMDTQHVAATLRLGVLYARKRDLPNANNQFNAADSLFQTLGSAEGRAEVLYQRGVLLRETSQLSAAEEQLVKALEIARTYDNAYQEIRAMLRLSSVFHLRGGTDEARRQASDAVNLAQRNGIENLAAQGLIDLGNTYLVRREYGFAEQVAKQAIDIAVRNAGQRNEAMGRLLLANLYVQQERNIDEALEFLTQASRFFERGGYSKELSQTILFRGRAKLLKGYYDEALADFQQSIPLAKRVNDRLQLANTYVLIGNVLRDRELYPDALSSFDESYALFKDLDIPTSISYLIIDRSKMLWRLGRYPEAETLLAQLPDVLARIDGNYRPLLLGRIALVKSEMAASRQQFSQAKTELDEAIKLAGKSPNHTTLEAKCVLASVFARSGAKKEALRVSQEAVEMANKVQDERLLSEAMISRAEAFLANDDARQSLTMALQAQERFARAGQQESEWRAWLTAATASERMSDTAASHEHSARAKLSVTGLEQRWGREAFGGYSTRRDIRRLLDELERFEQPH